MGAPSVRVWLLLGKRVGRSLSMAMRYIVHPTPSVCAAAELTCALVHRMQASRGTAVGVALHIQAAAWHNAHPVLQPLLAAAGTTFEGTLLQLLTKYGFATGPYGSAAWRKRPTYIMAFEVGGRHNEWSCRAGGGSKSQPTLN